MHIEETFDGFGHTHTLTEWARMACIDPMTFLYFVVVKDLTVEEVFRLRKREYKPPRERKPREGANMMETKNLVAQLLINSGYEVLPGSVAIVQVRRSVHYLEYKDRPLGWYDYRMDYLGGMAGDWLRLKDPRVPGQKIVQMKNGAWRVHPDTQARLREARQAAKKEDAVG